MKRGHNAVVSFLLIAAIFLFAGCGQKGGDQPSAEAEETEEYELFSEKNGIQLPTEVRRILDVVTAEVTEKDVTSRIEKAGHVYRAATAQSHAAIVVWLTEVEAKGLGEHPTVQIMPTNIAGKLIRIETKPSIKTEQLEALIEFADAGRQFPVGSTLTVAFSGARPHKALGIPTDAVIHGVAGAFVYSANGEHFVRTPVKLGMTIGDWVEVTEGLYEGDVVAAKAADSLWLIELCAIRGGTPCCPVETKPKKG